MGANINFKTVEDKLTAFALIKLFADGSVRLLVLLISKLCYSVFHIRLFRVFKPIQVIRTM